MIAHEIKRSGGRAGRFSVLAAYVLSDGQTSYRHLANYLETDRGEGDRVLYSRVTNCAGDDPEWAILEIEATQAQNRRALGDKTYHLVVSFREDEVLNQHQLTAIEEEICQHLGFGEHQRISAVHRDTDNLHIHLAINKIHPQRLTMHEPHYSHRALSDICVSLEHKYALQRDNHIDVAVRDRDVGARGRAGDMEAHSGHVSLGTWVRTQVQPLIEQCDSWQALHAALGESSLSIQLRGNGLVFKDRASDVAVKASAVDRSWSRSALEQRLGAYRAPGPAVAAIQPTRRYQAQPLAALERVETGALYRVFEAQQRARSAARTAALKAIGVSLARQRAAIKTEFREKHTQVQASHGRYEDRKGLYALLRMERLQRLGAVQAEGEAARRLVRANHPQQDWRGFLVERARGGDGVALSSLQRRGEAHRLDEAPRVPPDNNVVSAEATRAPGLPKVSYAFEVHRNGDVSYRMQGGGRLRDTAQGIVVVDKRPDAHTIEAAMRLASLKYGAQLRASGSLAFTTQASACARHARQMKLSLAVDRGPSRAQHSGFASPGADRPAAQPLVAPTVGPDPVLEGYLAGGAQYPGWQGARCPPAPGVSGGGRRRTGL